MPLSVGRSASRRVAALRSHGSRSHHRSPSGSTHEVDYEDIAGDLSGGDSDGIVDSLFDRTDGSHNSGVRSLAAHLAETAGVGTRPAGGGDGEVEERIAGADRAADDAPEVVEERLHASMWRGGGGGGGDGGEAASVNDADMASVITSVVGEGGATVSARMTLKPAHTLRGHSSGVTCAVLEDMVAKQSAFHITPTAATGASPLGVSPAGKPPAGDEDSFGVAAGVAATASLDGAVTVWDVAHGRTLAQVVHLEPSGRVGASRGRRRGSHRDATERGAGAGSLSGRRGSHSSTHGLPTSRPGTRVGSASGDGGGGQGGATNLEISADFGLHVAHVSARSPTPGERRTARAPVVAAGALLHPPTPTPTPTVAPTPTPATPAIVAGPDDQQPAIAVTAMAVLRRSSILVTGTADGAVWAWDTATGERLRHLSGHTDAVRCIAFHTDAMVGKTLGGHSVRSFSRVRRRGRTSHQRKRKSKSAALAGVRVASASLDQTVRVWDLSRRRQCQMHVLRGHTGPIHALTFVPNTWLVASCAADSTVRVWDIRSGRCKATLQVRVAL